MTQDRIKNQPPALGQTIFRYTIYLAAWLLFSALGLVLLFSLRVNFFNLGLELRLNPWQVRGIDRWYIFFFGMGWFVFMLWVENYLRVGVQQQQLTARLRHVAVWQIILLALSLLLQLPYGLELPFSR